MLQQTQVKTVIPYFDRWMGVLPTIESLANAASERIHKLWEGLGNYTRVRNMQSAARLILEKHHGKFPAQFDDVLALPGIGRYTAGAICSIAFNQPTSILDGNVIRVLTRIFAIHENAREKETSARLWSLAEELVRAAAQTSLSPQRGEGLRVRGEQSQNFNSRISRIESTGPLPVEGRERIRFAETIDQRGRQDHHQSFRFSGACSALNQSLMELGATVCTPKQPKCGLCPVAKLCVARRDNLIEQLPNLAERIASTARRFAACVVERHGTVLVRQRAKGEVNAHLWEFPNVEVALKSSRARTHRDLETELGCAILALHPLVTVKHTITRYRMTLEAFRGELNGTMPRENAGQWVAREELDRLPFTSAHRRILLAVLHNAGDTR